MKLPKCKPVKASPDDTFAHRSIDGVVLCGADEDLQFDGGWFLYCPDCNEIYQRIKELHVADENGEPACRCLPERVLRFATIVGFSETLASHNRWCGNGCSVVRWCCHCRYEAQAMKRFVYGLCGATANAPHLNIDEPAACDLGKPR